MNPVDGDDEEGDLEEEEARSVSITVLQRWAGRRPTAPIAEIVEGWGQGWAGRKSLSGTSPSKG